jgi:AraC-like DNA-binding protein
MINLYHNLLFGGFMRKLIPGERFVRKGDPVNAERYEFLDPYIRQSGNDWRTPWSMKERKLLDYLLVYIGSGEGEFTILGDSFSVGQRDLVLIPPDTLYEMRGTSELMNCVYMHFDLIYDPGRSHWDACIPGGTCDLSDYHELMHPEVRDPVISSLKGKLAVQNCTRIAQFMKEICVEHKRSVTIPDLRLKGLMLQLLYEILTNYSTSVSDKHFYYNQMQDAAADILDSFGALDISDLAKKYHLSESHFRRVFREVHGQSPGKMYSRNKIREACDKLCYTDMNISEIANAMGYSNVHNFSRAFKEVLKVSPSKYRKG